MNEVDKLKPIWGELIQAYHFYDQKPNNRILNFKGSYTTFDILQAAFANNIIKPYVNDVFNITTTGGTDSRGTPIRAGDNIVLISYEDKDDPHTYTWSILGSSNILEAESLSTRNKIDLICRFIQDFSGNTQIAENLWYDLLKAMDA